MCPNEPSNAWQQTFLRKLLPTQTARTSGLTTPPLAAVTALEISSVPLLANPPRQRSDTSFPLILDSSDDIWVGADTDYQHSHVLTPPYAECCSGFNYSFTSSCARLWLFACSFNTSIVSSNTVCPLVSIIALLTQVLRRAYKGHFTFRKYAVRNSDK